MKKQPLDFSPPRSTKTCAVSFAISDQDEILIKVKAPKEWAHLLSNTLAELSELASAIKRTTDEATRRITVTPEVAAWNATLTRIASAYWSLRDHGTKHRAALASVMTDPAFSDLKISHRWVQANYSWAVKAFRHPSPSSTPTSDPGLIPFPSSSGSVSDSEIVKKKLHRGAGRLRG
jgi:hypothetical protein